MVFTKKAALRQFLFVLLLFALLIPTAIWDSNAQVKVQFNADIVNVKCDKFRMSVPYADISSAELVPLAEAGDPMDNAFDNDIFRSGSWTNDAWGEYIIIADLDTTTCIKLDLQDGRTFLFSRKSDKATAEDFEVLQTYLTP